VLKTQICVTRPQCVKMRNVSDKSCRENHNTHFMFRFFFENHVVYEIMWKNIVEPERPQMTVWRMRISRWIPKATHTHTLRIGNTPYFSTATMLARTRFRVGTQL